MDAEALKNLGNARKEAGDLEGAAARYREALRADERYIPALYNLGLVLRAAGRLDEAESCFRRVQELDPADADALIHLADLLSAGSRHAEAAETCRQALRLAPANAYLWLQLAAASKALGDAGGAAQAYRTALELEPDAAQAHNDFANLLQEDGHVEDAIDHYRTAIRLAPDFARAHSNLGCALVLIDRLGEALGALTESIRIDPADPDAHLNLGSVQSLLGQRDRALASFLEALARRPGDAAIRECVLLEMQHMCDWSRFEELCALQRRDALDPGQRINPFSLLSIPSTPAEQLECARACAARCERTVAGERARLGFRFERRAERRIRIGYLSADFHDHVTAYVMAEMFELHDRARFEVSAYSYGPDDGSAMRVRLKAAFDRFIDGRTLSHTDLARAIHADRVDILVDLKGYTQQARLEVAALRPAPVQAAYMGYPGTLGGGFIDYLIADRRVIPPGHEKDYGEKLVFVPGSYYANDRKRVAAPPPPRTALGLPAGSFVFCCFNQAYKILPEVFDAWMRLLAAVPASVLWLLEVNPWAKANLGREAQRRGIDPARLVFAPRVSADQYLGRVAVADLFLDTRPYNAHTTATDALWMGVPVVTCPGDTFAARVGASLLHAMGLPELITSSMAEYESLASRLARSPQELAALRARVQRGRSTAVLFDTPQFTRAMETGYERMWEGYLAGRPPANIQL